MESLQQRKSHTAINEIYFWTATIHKWMHLMEDDSNKKLIVDYMKKLSDEGLITVYAFVIMPNHIHLTCLPAGRFGNKTNSTAKKPRKAVYLNIQDMNF